MKLIIRIKMTSCTVQFNFCLPFSSYIMYSRHGFWFCRKGYCVCSVYIIWTYKIYVLECDFEKLVTYPIYQNKYDIIYLAMRRMISLVFCYAGETELSKNGDIELLCRRYLNYCKLLKSVKKFTLSFWIFLNLFNDCWKPFSVLLANVYLNFFFDVLI
jgi:hypothetical protein